jgi:octaprenyl-diphosphate synthase
VLDYSGELQQTGKNLGDDLAEGKPTLPLIRAMRSGSAEQAGLVRAAVLQGGMADFAKVLATIVDTGALDYTRARARQESACAQQAIAQLPRTNYRECLIQLADFAVTRSY